MFMKHRYYFGVFLVFLGTMLPLRAAAQSDDGISLGDLARSLRESKNPTEPAAPTVIDNDNLSKVIDDVQHLRLGMRPMFSFDEVGRISG